MRAPVKSIFVSIAVFLLLCGSILFFAFMYLTEQAPQDVIDDVYTAGTLSLYKYGMVEKLTAAEIRKLYQETCTRKCHGKDVIEKNRRTAFEWENVVNRMKAPDRADIADRYAETITHYLQNNFLSNVPTVLPENTMKFVKRHLWKSDFGESDLFLDVIYVPREHLRLLPYLGVRNIPQDQQAAIFIVYINTHQGTVPPWNLAEMVTLHDNHGLKQKATGWEVLYQDGQRHHNQGTLVFPAPDANITAELEIQMRLPGLEMRKFLWNLPIPPMPEGGPVER
ncbi:MAG: hypothetical protein OEV23_07005 [Gallionella sp.]|nr:hypothetical protein [Gallionella sp.]